MHPAVQAQITPSKIPHRKFRQVRIRVHDRTTSGRGTQPNRRQRNLAALVADTVSGGDSPPLEVTLRSKPEVVRVGKGRQQLSVRTEQGQDGAVVRGVATALPAALLRSLVGVFLGEGVAHLDDVQVAEADAEDSLGGGHGGGAGIEGMV